MTLDTTAPVGQIAKDHPLTTRVFARHGIDFCCGGGKPLADAAEERGLEVDRLMAEIRGVIDGGPDSERRWDDAPSEDLIDHILDAYHTPLREELVRLEAMARKVQHVHGHKDPALAVLLETFLALKQDLKQHMVKEELILFPMVRTGQTDGVGGSVATMQEEHEAAGEALRILRAITDDYTVPEGACNTWRALWHGLAALEKDLHMHIHLENNILFPQVMAQ